MRRLQVVLGMLAGVGCGDGTGPGGDSVHYQFELAAFGGDTTPERARTYECLVYGFFDLPLPLSSDSLVRFSVRVERRLFETSGKHSETTSADTTIAEAVMDYAGLGDDSLQFVLTAGPYTASLGPGGSAAGNPVEYMGEWSCGPDVPLALDSTLVAYGYDPALSIPGRWRITELLPIE